jgi:hypothetical protein
MRCPAMPAGPRDRGVPVRTLFGNPTVLPADAAWPLTYPVPCALAWCALILAVAVPLTVWRFRVRTTD